MQQQGVSSASQHRALTGLQVLDEDLGHVQLRQHLNLERALGHWLVVEGHVSSHRSGGFRGVSHAGDVISHGLEFGLDGLALAVSEGQAELA